METKLPFLDNSWQCLHSWHLGGLQSHTLMGHERNLEFQYWQLSIMYLPQLTQRNFQFTCFLSFQLHSSVRSWKVSPVLGLDSMHDCFESAALQVLKTLQCSASTQHHTWEPLLHVLVIVYCTSLLSNCKQRNLNRRIRANLIGPPRSRPTYPRNLTRPLLMWLCTERGHYTYTILCTRLG